VDHRLRGGQRTDRAAGRDCLGGAGERLVARRGRPRWSGLAALPGLGREATDILEAALRLLSAAEQERLRDTFLAWFRLSASRTGVDLEFL
jgi:hypothetical protein